MKTINREKSRLSNPIHLSASDGIVVKMVRTCVVQGCGNRDSKTCDKGFYNLPAIINNQGTVKKELSIRRRQKWILKINRIDVSQGDVKFVYVCSDHFYTGELGLIIFTA